MVTYCKHSNAPVEYALKEEELLRPKPSKVKAWTFEAKDKVIQIGLEATQG